MDQARYYAALLLLMTKPGGMLYSRARFGKPCDEYCRRVPPLVPKLHREESR